VNIPFKSSRGRLWRWRGQTHRNFGPAIECQTGSKVWYRFGIPHRFGGPSAEWANGSLSWHYEGKRFRERSIGIPDLVFPIRNRGVRIWLDESIMAHRINGPAHEYDDGRKKWYRHGYPVACSPAED